MATTLEHEDSRTSEEVAISNGFVPPSVCEYNLCLLDGDSYTHHSDVPSLIQTNTASTSSAQGTPCVLGVDEAGRGPVIGPMIYGVFYLPIQFQHSLLASTHHFDDSKVLTPVVRANLMKAICTPGTDLYQTCGWAIRSLSARDIGSGMLRHGGTYNLNAQAMDATISLIKEVIEKGVNVVEVYVDTIGAPAVYQKKLERIFPTVKITVEKKADSLYPCVSAASVVAKVTRDVSCEVLEAAWKDLVSADEEAGWGSGYPSDARCVAWLKQVMDPVFGWGNECRFSWGTLKDLLETKVSDGIKTDWPAVDDEDNMQLSSYFGSAGPRTEVDELRTWFGTSIGQDVF